MLLSRGRSVGLRMVPMERDLRFAWEELAQQVLDVQQEKVRASLQAALIQWAVETGQGSDYTDNLPEQCLHPVGHWYEVPNLLLNATLARLIEERPGLRWLMLHNVDTLGANVDPALLGLFASEGACLAFEVVPRCIDDRGGGLARVDGRPRLVEGMALPREEEEWRLSYYNSMTTWVDVDRLLAVFGLERGDLNDGERVVEGRARHGPPTPDLRDAEGRQEALGARPGGRVPGDAVRETLERYDGASGRRLSFLRSGAVPRAAAQGARAIGWMVAGRVGGVRGAAVPVRVNDWPWNLETQ